MRPIALLLLLVMVALVAGCGNESTGAAKPAEVVPPGIFVPPAELAASLRVEPVAERSVAENLRVAGRVDFDERHLARIGTQVPGRITQIVAHLGQQVKRGDVLAILHSTELGNAQLAYLKAIAQTEVSQRAVERAKELFAADVIGRAELQKRESDLKVAQAELLSASTQLELLGMREQEVDELKRTGNARASTAVRSTIDGTVVERQITQGQVVQAADLLFAVADLGELWVVAEVPEQQSDGVRVGQTVKIEIPALAATYETPLILVDNKVNPETRTVLVRASLMNRDGRLKPQMLATMAIPVQPKMALALPESAVVFEAAREQVFVEDAPGRYRLRPVKLGELHMGLRPVLDGVKPGDRIVVEGGFHLNNARKQAELGD
jgi:cobalt-zinc-cadmium efflux system membrane fusion protein